MKLGKKKDDGLLEEHGVSLGEPWLKRLLDQMPGILWATDRDLRVTISVGAGLTHVGLENNEAVGKNLLAFFKNQDPNYPPTKAHLQALAGISSDYEIKFGGRFFHSYVEPLRDPSGEIVGVVGVGFDISDREAAEQILIKRAEQAFEYQSVLLELAKMDHDDLEGALKRIIELDARTMGVERVSVWFFDSTRSSILCELLFKKNEKGFEKGIRLESKDYPHYFRALEESRTIAANDVLTDPRTKEFSEIYLKPLGIVSMLDVPIRIGGKVVGILCHEHVGPLREWSAIDQNFGVSIADMISLVMEASERRKAELALQETTDDLIRSNQELEQFAYVASHDLQEPLHKIIAFVDRVHHRLEDQTDDKVKDYLQIIEKSAERMRNLIKDLFQLARVTTHGQPFETVDLKKTLEGVVSDMELRLKEMKAKIEIGSLPVVMGDPLQLYQLFQNLISNALKFVRKDVPPCILIESGSPYNGFVKIIVKDNGIGIEAKYFDKIFDPFQRLHSREEYEGSGIGLTICQKILKRHGGKVKVSSCVGEGTMFEIMLPLAT